MTCRVILRRAARIEYDAAGDWYEQQRPGLGAAFTAAVQQVFDRIAAHPQMHGVVLRGIRKAVVQGFPYCVYYRERSSAVVVLSVFHTSRDSNVWQSRA
jgi:toxin ParE1/3/4